MTSEISQYIPFDKKKISQGLEKDKFQNEASVK